MSTERHDAALAGDPRQRGFTLVEVMVALVVLVMSAMGMQLAMGVTTKLNGQNAALEQARAVVTDQIEELAALEPPDVVDGFWVVDGTAFDVPHFQAPPGVAQVGLIEVLTEAQASLELGTSMDLDGDGNFAETEDPHSGFTAACVRVTVTWTNDGKDASTQSNVGLVLPSAE